MKYSAIFLAIACVSVAETTTKYLHQRMGHQVLNIKQHNARNFKFTFNWTSNHRYFFALKFVHIANKNKSVDGYDFNVTLPNSNSSFNYSGITYGTGKEWCGVYAFNKSAKCKSDNTGSNICQNTPQVVSRWPPTLKIYNYGFNVRFYYAFFRCISNTSKSTPHLAVATKMRITETTTTRQQTGSTTKVTGTTELNTENTGTYPSPLTESMPSASSKETSYLIAAMVLGVLLVLTYLGILLKIGASRFKGKTNEGKPEAAVRYDSANGQVAIENPYAMADNFEPPQEINENDAPEPIMVNNELYNMDE